MDAVFTEFVAALDVTIRTGRSCECYTSLKGFVTDKNSGHSPKGYRGRIICGIRSISDEPSFIFHTPRSISFSHEGKAKLLF